MNNWATTFLFGWYPYIAFGVFLVASWRRFEGEPHIQDDGSGRLFSRRHLTWGVILFHVGILILFAGHLVGLLTPIQVFESLGISHALKQGLANVIGGTGGTLALAGLLMLLRRRVADTHLPRSSLFGDVALLLLIVVQLGLGLSSIAVAVTEISNGCGALPFMWWAQSIVTLKPGAAVGYIASVPLIFKLHIVNGLTILLVLPFTRLVNLWSVPAWFLARGRAALAAATRSGLGRA